MKLSTLLLLSGAVLAGIYITSKEGDETRKRLRTVNSNIAPIVKDLIRKAEGIIEKSKSLKSDEIRLNLEKKVDEVKHKLSTLNANEVTDKSLNAIKNASKSIRQMWTEVRNDAETMTPESTDKTTVKTPTKKSAKLTVAKTKTQKTI